MAVLKKNQVNQILFTMVDKTDHVTLETSLASNFTIKRVGVNHGSAAANISTLSRAPSKVGSGLYRLSLEANATNYDYVALRIAHASALTQILVYEMRTYDDTDTFSQLSDIGSNVLSYLAGMSGVISDVYSLLSDVNSNFGSRIPKEVANASQLLLMKSQLSDTYSLLSDFQSDFASRVPKELASKSLLSDVNSNLLSYLGGISNILSAVYVDTADISNVLSNVHADLANLSGIVSDFYSDFQSRVTKEAANASQLLLVKSMASDAASAAQQANSRVLLNQSRISDTYSMLSDFYSDFGSRVPKEMPSKSLVSDYHSDLKSAVGAIVVTIGASDVSDIASAVIAGMTTLTPSDISDIASAVWAYGTRKITSLADVSLCASDLSDIRSAITAGGGALTDSNISDIASAVWAYGTKEVSLGASDLSDIVSGIIAGGVATQSKLGAVETSLLDTRSKLVVMSGIQSDIYSLLSDMDSNFQSRIPKEVASKSLLSDINSNLLSFLGGISDTLSAVYVDTTDISNVVSNIHADLANLSGIGSDIYSLLSDLNSNLDSRIPKEVATKSLLSDVNSNLLSYLAGVSNTLSTVKVSMDIVEDINRNKMEITDANGNLVLYEDDGMTPKYSVNACVTDDATTTIRKRLE
jgi:hypothetical protein